jgi:uncharacterized protein (TIGR02271 family)
VIRNQELDRAIGANAIGSDGDKIGKVETIYLDDQTGEPEFALVNTGMFGMRSSFVPLRSAELTGDGDLRVPHSKDEVKDAPNLDADDHLEPSQEDELYRYYGMTGPGRAQGTPDTDSDRPTGTVGHDTSGPETDDAMTRSEEEVHVGKREHEVGRARLRKHVVTDHVTETVPVQREEVRVEREPVTDENVDAATDGPAISEEEHEVVLHEEEPVVEKRTVPKDRVRLDKETETDEATVDEDVKKETIDVAGLEESRQDQRR